MTTSLPDPLVPADVDLSTFDWMPFYGAKLLESEHNVRCDDTAFRASITIWWKAWHEVPAASLPADDELLCAAAGLERDRKTWKRVRAYALRNFVLCSDGRLYHTFLAEKAIAAWAMKLKAAAKGSRGAAKRWEGHTAKRPKKKTHVDMPGPVDNRGTTNESASSSHAHPIAQASISSGTGNATATGFNGEGKKLSQAVSQLEPRHGSAVDNPPPQEEKSKSKQRATPPTETAAHDASTMQAAHKHVIDNLPQPLREILVRNGTKS
jgi:hypothetical protein